jgi:hypothetical protein
LSFCNSLPGGRGKRGWVFKEKFATYLIKFLEVTNSLFLFFGDIQKEKG